MSLELRRGVSEWWYGTFKINGRKFTKNLGIKVQGVVPPSLREMGDIVFERSRAKAQAASEKFQEELKRRSSAEELVQTIHEIRTGARVSSIPLTEMGTRWSGVLRRRPLSASYQKQKVACIDRFVRFLKDLPCAPRNGAGAGSAGDQFLPGGIGPGCRRENL